MGEHKSNSLTPLHKGMHKAKHKVKRKYNLLITLITNNNLVILKDQKQNLSQYKILEDRFAMKSSSMWVNKTFEKETQRENSWENSWIDIEMKNKKLDSQNLFSFDFPKLWNK